MCDVCGCFVRLGVKRSKMGGIDLLKVGSAEIFFGGLEEFESIF